jgi:hypothetical protein
MRLLSIAVALLVTEGLCLGLAPQTSAQRRRVIIVERFPHYYPWGFYPYPYAPYGYYVGNYGEVKIDTHRKDLSVFIDGGFAANTKDDKKFKLRPGNHDIELRDPEGQTVVRENVAVTFGKTTKLAVPS